MGQDPWHTFPRVISLGYNENPTYWEDTENLPPENLRHTKLRRQLLPRAIVAIPTGRQAEYPDKHHSTQIAPLTNHCAYHLHVADQPADNPKAATCGYNALTHTTSGHTPANHHAICSECGYFMQCCHHGGLGQENQGKCPIKGTLLLPTFISNLVPTWSTASSLS